MEEDNRRSIMLMPPDAMRRKLRKLMPDLNEEEVEAAMRASVRMREDDPLAVLQEGSLEGGKDGGQMNMFKLAPNFEMTMYLAQATGACIVTDSPFRWSEVQGAIRRRFKAATPGLARARDRHRALEIRVPAERDGRGRRCLEQRPAPATRICFETSSSIFPTSKSAGRNPIAKRSWSAGSPKRMRRRRRDFKSRAFP